MNTTDGKVVFTLKVDEPNGFGTDAYQLEVSTRSFVSPLVEVVDYTITSNQSGVLAKKIPFDLQILVQNTKQGYADNVKVTLSLPEGVFCLTGNETLDYSGLQAGEKKSIVYNLIVNDKFVGTSIPIKIKVSEKYNKYAKDKDISLSLNESMSSTKIEVLAENKQNNINIQIGSLSSDVDKNIPLNNLSYTNRYALIIGNEDYSSWQKGLSTEINVDYAENDARIFKEYCVKTMGIPEKQVKLLSNATSSQMSQGLAWLNNLAKVENGKAELIFYYSGHGLPDEQTKESYLIPVDVSGSNITQGLKIADVYSKLTEYPSQKVTVFLDACFSGGARNQALIAQKTVKINPKKEQIKGNLIVFTSSSGEESSGVYREQKHGFFTYYLLKKLQETKGDVTYNELNNYIKASVSKETSLIGKPQNPEVLVSPQIENSWSNWKIK
ncbi:MAG: Caspase domain protein [Bacteroidetes bacterium ADurb.Bin408]|nr:MAG: Caspase domain protein [Bacteroidetes bacterium ADurb.Bin408]